MSLALECQRAAHPSAAERITLYDLRSTFMNRSSRQFSLSSRLFTAALAIFLLVSMVSSPAVTFGQGGTPAATAQPCASVSDNGEKIKIGAVIPLTGAFAAGGAQIQGGYQLAVEDINKAGGVVVNCEKYQLDLKILDDASDPTKTGQQMEALHADDVIAYLGGFGSGLHAAAVPVAEKYKTPYLGVAFALYGIHQKGYKYLFSPFPKS